MKDGKLGAAIFGAGWVAGEHAKAYQKCERTRLVAVGSRKAESAKNCAQAAGAPDAFVTTDYDALLAHPDVDVISITTPRTSTPSSRSKPPRPASTSASKSPSRSTGKAVWRCRKR